MRLRSHRVSQTPTVAQLGFLLVLTLILGSCGDSGTDPIAGPPDRSPLHIAIAAGNAQTAPVSTVLPVAPAVLVSDASGNPLSGVAVTFAVASGGGSVTDANQTTDAAGLATVCSWTVGASAGPNTLTATAAGEET
jgi:hypothetical protein